MIFTRCPHCLWGYKQIRIDSYSEDDATAMIPGQKCRECDGLGLLIEHRDELDRHPSG